MTMDKHTATEQAYKRGYEDGKQDALKWISVKERLPGEDGKYLVFEQSCGRTCTAVLRFAKDARKVDKYDFKDRWKNAWYEYDSEWGHYTVNSVTHWMPLPEQPKQEQQANTDRCVCCGAIIPEGQIVCPNCLVTVKEG
jgi:hypothetical protein